MIDQSDIDKLRRFNQGLCDVKEEEYVRNLFTKNEGSPEFKQHLQTEFNEYLKRNPNENHRLDYLLDRIHHIIHKNESLQKKTIVRTIYQWYSVVAAVILIPLLVVGGVWWTNQDRELSMMVSNKTNSTLYAPLGSRISFSLPDGTSGWLNSGSSLEYSLPFNHNRHIAVTGEAWFDVAHDVEHPFEIDAGESKVTVLGTKFNLSAYPDEKFVEVVLEEGKVVFSTSGLTSAIEMKPNERLVMKQGAIDIMETDASKFGAWKEGKLVFRGDLMGEVVRRMERWYNVEIELVDPALEEYAFQGTFQDDSLEEVLRCLRLTSPIRYRILDRKRLPDGTMQKTKVLIYKEKI